MYMGWNGRFGEVLRAGLGYLSIGVVAKFIYAILGSVLILLFFIFLFARPPQDRYFDISILFLIVICLMTDSAFGAIFFWTTGVLNYLLAYVLILSHLIVYRIYWQGIFFGLPNNTHKVSLFSDILLSLIHI